MALTPLQRTLAGACCVAAGAAAYLLPGAVARASAPTTTAAPTPTASARRPSPAASRSVSPSASASASSAASPSPSASTPTAAATSHAGVSTSVHGSTAPRLPSPVRSLHLAGNTDTGFTVAWTASARATHYRVLLVGTQVADTTATQATLSWPAGLSTVLVQVAPVTAGGVLGEWRAIVVVRATTTVTATASATPSASASSSAPDATPTSQPTNQPPGDTWTPAVNGGTTTATATPTPSAEG